MGAEGPPSPEAAATTGSKPIPCDVLARVQWSQRETALRSGPDPRNVKEWSIRHLVANISPTLILSGAPKLRNLSRMPLILVSDAPQSGIYYANGKALVEATKGPKTSGLTWAALDYWLGP